MNDSFGALHPVTSLTGSAASCWLAGDSADLGSTTGRGRKAPDTVPNAGHSSQVSQGQKRANPHVSPTVDRYRAPRPQSAALRGWWYAAAGYLSTKRRPSVCDARQRHDRPRGITGYVRLERSFKRHAGKSGGIVPIPLAAMDSRLRIRR